MADVSPDDAEERRARNLRRHAIETGIIERLYDLEWGVTEALVAEGLTLDVAERDGGVSDSTLETINAQLNGLNLLVNYLREDRPFSSSFIKELHSSITAAQDTYEARDQFGSVVQIPLPHGAWKTTDNHVKRSDGSLLQYTPAIFVVDEIDALVSLYNKYLDDEDIHPVALAAWLHHRFISIHPFADGNGRVARALTLLVLLQRGYAPVVVRREDREEYIEALDRANFGDLEVLIRFFARLEEYAILAELEARPNYTGSSAVQVAKEYAKQLKAKLEFSDNERRNGIAALNTALLERSREELTRVAAELKATFTDVDPRTDAWVLHAAPPKEPAHHWRREIIRAAKEVDFYTNLQDGTWWALLNLKLLDSAIRYGVVFQKVGFGESGIAALTFFAETYLPQDARVEADGSFTSEVLLRLRPSDGVNFLHTDEVESVWPRVESAINQTLTASIKNYLERVSP